jgi:hypothetical protein
MPRRFAAAATIVLLAQAVHAEPAAVPLELRVYDTSGEEPARLHIAQTVLVTMFRAAGIEVEWRQCHTRRGPSALASCGQVLGSREIVMRLAATPRTERNPDVLGFAYIDAQIRRGTLGTVYADRVRTLARHRGADPAQMLGRAMAHEVAHLLLGSDEHASSGVMRRALSGRDHAGEWVFSAEEAGRMREALAIVTIRAAK